MSELDTALGRLRRHDGVEQLILLGSDGLVIQSLGDAGDEEPVAARIPGIASACAALGSASDSGALSTAVIEFQSRVAIVSLLSPDLILALIVRPGVGFAGLLRELRTERDRLVELL